MNIGTMQQRVERSAAERRFALLLFEAFGVAALVLAAVGTYGLLSGVVGERAREIAVRAALGATRGGIVALVLRQGMLPVSAGIGIGVVAATVAARLLETLLFGVSRLDALTYAVVVVALLASSALACWLPAQRAARVDANTVLRTG